MHPNEEVIHKLYEAFAKKDGDTMASCYAKDATFSDPVFLQLKGDEVTTMWSMLTARATDLAVRHSDVVVTESKGSCKWEADYTFAKTKRFVKNRIAAEFTFSNGLIKSHVDTFSFYRWTSMALGPTGFFMGWLPSVQNKVRAEADRGLRVFMKARARGRV
jgi:ketosteroid isomerase-like protein